MKGIILQISVFISVLSISFLSSHAFSASSKLSAYHSNAKAPCMACHLPPSTQKEVSK